MKYKIIILFSLLFLCNCSKSHEKELEIKNKEIEFLKKEKEINNFIKQNNKTNLKNEQIDRYEKNKEYTQVEDVESEVLEIRQYYNMINSSALTSKSYNYSNKCGIIKATITLFYLNGEIVKITDNGKGDDDKPAEKWNYEYYYKKNNLIFSYEWTKSYNNEIEKSNIDERREYFNLNQTIKKIENKETTYPSNYIVSQTDNRYLLKEIKSSQDINKIYKCSNTY